MKKYLKQNWVVPAAGIVITAVFVLARIAPAAAQQKAVRQELAQQQQALSEIEQQNRTLDRLTQQRADLKNALEAFNARIPDGRSFALLWQQIADVMNACSLSDQVVQPGSEIRTDSLCCIPLVIECRGSVEQIFAFFRMLEGMERLIRIEEVRLENGNHFDAAVKVTAKANVYYQPSAGNG